MVWKPDDAPSHTRKANTPKKRRQWAAVANSALSTYHGNEGKAIAAANAAMGDAFWLDGMFIKDAFAAEYPLFDLGRRVRDDDDDDDDDDDRDDKDEDDDDDDDDDDQTSDALKCDYRSPFRHAIYDKDFSQVERKELTAKGQAMPSGGYPIRNTGDLKKAIQAIGRAKDPDAAKRWIKKRARALGASNMIPESWGDSASCIDCSIPMLSTPLVAILGDALVDDGTIGLDPTTVRDGVTSLRMSDAVELDDAAKVRIRADGSLSAMPRIARTGIQLYRGSECGLRDGAERDAIVRVYRPESSVFASDAWHTYTHLPVTLEHPPVAVDSNNWKKYAVGETGEEVLRDGQAARVPMMLRDAAAVQAWKDGKNQLSVGYDCDIEWSQGVTDDGEPYDAIQRNIRANHLAVVAAARGGPTLKIGDHSNDRGETQMSLRTLTIDGLSVQMTDQAAEVVQKAMRSLQDDVAALKKWQKAKKDEDDDRDDEDQKKDQALAAKDEAIKTKDKDIAAKDGQIETLKKQLADAKEELTPAKLDARVKDRLLIVQKAKGILGDKITCDGKTDAEIRKAVVVARVGDQAKDWGDDKIAGAFDTLSVTRQNEFARTTNNPQRDSIDQAIMAFGSAGPLAGRPGSGYGQMDARDAAYTDYNNDLQNAWRGGTNNNNDQQRH